MRIDISGASAVIRNQEILTVGMVGAKAEFRFSEEWNGLGKIAVFRQAGVSKDVTLTSAVATIPWEVLHAPGLPVSIGVHGANSDGTVVIPTIWVETRPLRPGADPSGDESADPTLPVWGQLQAQMTELYAAVNEHAANSAAPIVVESSGESIAVSDGANRAFQGFKIYGKTTQEGTPAPDSPVEIVSAGHEGSIAVSVIGENESQSMTIATPNGLPGVPVSTGGNYTDANGQQWVCDEIDFSRGVYVSRVCTEILDGVTNVVAKNDSNSNEYLYYYRPVNVKQNTQGYCTHFRHSDMLPANAGYSGVFNLTIYSVIYLNGYGIVSGDNGTLSNPSEFNNWLNAQYNAGTPVTVLYILATPIETPLPDEVLAAYDTMSTYRDQTAISNDAGAWMELEYVMDGKKYMDSIIAGPAAKLSEVFLPASAWKGSGSLYSQVVSIEGITEYSKVDLLPSVEQLAIFHNKDVAFVTENEDGVVTVYAIGTKPTQDYSMQVGITEVAV